MEKKRLKPESAGGDVIWAGDEGLALKAPNPSQRKGKQIQPLFGVPCRPAPFSRQAHPIVFSPGRGLHLNKNFWGRLAGCGRLHFESRQTQQHPSQHTPKFDKWKRASEREEDVLLPAAAAVYSRWMMGMMLDV